MNEALLWIGFIGSFLAGCAAVMERPSNISWLFVGVCAASLLAFAYLLGGAG